jgi:hypothetical protein
MQSSALEGQLLRRLEENACIEELLGEDLHKQLTVIARRQREQADVGLKAIKAKVGGETDGQTAHKDEKTWHQRQGDNRGDA